MASIKTLIRQKLAESGLNSGIIKVTNEVTNITNGAYDIVNKEEDSKGRLSHKIKRQRIYKAQMQKDELANAIIMAEDPENPNRKLLHSIYKETIRDRHFFSQVRTNILKIVGSPFAVYKKGTDTIDEPMTKALQTAWFEMYRKLFHETPWWGHSLVEFQSMVESDKKGIEYEFKHIKLFPRAHVIPERGLITINPYDDTTGIPFREAPFNKWLMEIGEPDDIGLLNLAAEEVIWKKYSRSDWSRHSEKFGMPLLGIKTSTRDKKELDDMEDMASNFGSNGWIILDDEDEVQIMESSKNGQPYAIYKEKAIFCNDEMSKLVNGQTMTSDDGSSYSQAEVHERILGEYVEAGMRSETFHVNDDLFPFLEGHGYPLKDREFKYLALSRDKDKGDKNAGDQKIGGSPKKIGAGKEDPPGKENDKAPGGTVNFTKPLEIGTSRGWLSRQVENIYNTGQCCASHSVTASGIDLTPYENQVIIGVYQRLVSPGHIDQQMFESIRNYLYKGATKEYGDSFATVKYGSPSHQKLLNFRYNVSVFAAFKNHHNTAELAKALLDENGKVRSFSQFKKAAGLINSKYNKNWLKTEYRQAVIAGNNAAKWQKFEANKKHMPYLKYIVVRDDRLSAICQELDGATYPVDAAFWNRYAPPNHWGCRSTLISLPGPAKEVTVTEELPETFDNNPGKTLDPFGKHPYYEVLDQYKDAAKRMFGVELPIDSDQIMSNIKAWELLDRKLYTDIKTFNESGGFVARHITHTGDELASNMKVGELLAKTRGDRVILREIKNVDFLKNPDATVNDVRTDFKALKSKKANALNKRIGDARNQGVDNVYIKTNASDDDIIKGLYQAFRNDKKGKIKAVHIIRKDKITTVTVEQYRRGVIEKAIK